MQNKIWLLDFYLTAINRTILELKLQANDIKVLRILAINLTILELKQLEMTEDEICTEAINRTILELKLQENREFSNNLELLIAPFWN